LLLANYLSFFQFILAQEKTLKVSVCTHIWPTQLEKRMRELFPSIPSAIWIFLHSTTARVSCLPTPAAYRKKPQFSVCRALRCGKTRSDLRRSFTAQTKLWASIPIAFSLPLDPSSKSPHLRTSVLHYGMAKPRRGSLRSSANIFNETGASRKICEPAPAEIVLHFELVAALAHRLQ